MKIIVLYAAMRGYEHSLDKVIKIVRNTLEELSVIVEEVNLSLVNIPYFDGIKSQSVENIFNSIKSSDGVIFAASSQLMAPCGIMQTFLEHFNYDIYGEVISNKNCYVITASIDGSERKANEYLNSIIYSLGGADSCNISIGKHYQSILDKDGEVKEIIEKYTEDFYRIVRQNRKFFKIDSISNIKNTIDMTQADIINPKLESKPEYKTNNIEEVEDNTEKITSKQFTKLFGHEPKPQKIKKEDILQKLDLESFNERQEEDINEITKMITSQYGTDLTTQSRVSNIYKSNSKFSQSAEPTPHIKTCRQRTQSLYHYFQPQLAGNLNVTIQINIKGTEKFECYLVIKDSECVYYDGVYEDPDVTVFADTQVWNNILDGKFTTQKAFMIGQLKVRGNFVILTKFDQLFKMHV